jgi:hypothetical protein
MNRRTTWGIAIGVAVSLALVFSAYEMRTAGPPAAPGTMTDTGTATAAPSAPDRNLSVVNLGALNAPKPAPTEIVRDPFRFKPRAPPPPPPAASARRTVPEELGPVAPAPPPRIPLKFIGLIDSPRQGVIAVLSDARGVYHGGVGQTIEGRYRIERIGVESIDLSYIDGRGRQTIRLTGQ